MTILAGLRSFLRALLNRRRLDREMTAELHSHVQARVEDLIAHGVARETAEAMARRELGDLSRWREQGREARGVRVIDELLADLRYALRQLRRSSIFTFAAAVSLALGTGANIAIFSLMNAVVLRPLPIPQPSTLWQISHGGQRGESDSSNYQWFRQLQDRTDLFSSVAAVDSRVASVDVDGQYDSVVGQRVMGDYYGTLGIPPAAGRLLTPRDRAADAVAVISDDYWRARFNASPDAIGRVIAIDGRAVTIVGVTPPGFFGIQVGRRADVTLPLDRETYDEANSWSSVPILARLRQGVSPTHAQQALGAVLTQAAVAAGVSEQGRDASFQRVVLKPAGKGLSALRDEFSTSLQLLLGVVAVLLALACVNLAGLLVARNSARETEIGTRLALGAGRARIVRQLLTESALLAAIGLALGIGVGSRLPALLLAMLPDGGAPRSLRVDFDLTVALFTAAVAITTVLACGTWPAIRASRTHLSMVQRSWSVSPAQGLAGRALVSLQMALAIVLVSGAILLGRNLMHFAGVDAGFARDHVAVGALRIAEDLTPEAAVALQQTLLARVRSLPGVVAGTLGSITPLNGQEHGRPVVVPGSTAPLVQDPSLPPVLGPPSAVTQVSSVGGDFFATFGIAITDGRPIVDADALGAPRVAVVNDAFARQHFGGERALGHRFRMLGGRPADYEIVGVAANARHRHLRSPAVPMVYVSQFQLPEEEIDLAVRTAGDMTAAVAAIQQAIRTTASGPAPPAVISMARRIDTSLWRERLLAAFCGFFAVVALILATIGTYALVAHSVAGRRFEIGLRIALGAKPASIGWQVCRRTLWVAGVGCAAGLAIALIAFRNFESFLFDVTPSDPLTMGLSVAILLGVALAAAAVPARRAMVTDPLRMLRSD